MIAGFFISITSDTKKLYREPTSIVMLEECRIEYSDRINVLF